MNLKLTDRIIHIPYVRSVMTEGADLSAFKEPPTPRIITGLCVMGLSYIIGWPAVSALGVMAVWMKEPLILAVGGPLIYGLSHLVFLLGFYLAGAKYTKIFLRWATRKAVERFIGTDRFSDVIESSNPVSGEENRVPCPASDCADAEPVVNK